MSKTKFPDNFYVAISCDVAKEVCVFLTFGPKRGKVLKRAESIAAGVPYEAFNLMGPTLGPDLHQWLLGIGVGETDAAQLVHDMAASLLKQTRQEA